MSGGNFASVRYYAAFSEATAPIRETYVEKEKLVHRVCRAGVDFTIAVLRGCHGSCKSANCFVRAS
jgi:hypothetical protein